MFLPHQGIPTICIGFNMRWSREGQGVRTPSLINHKHLVFLSNTGPDPQPPPPPPQNKKKKKSIKKKKSQSYQASVQCLSITNPPVKHRLIGVSLAPYGVSLKGRWWPAFSAILIFSALIRKNVVRDGLPLAKLTWSPHDLDLLLFENAD